MSWTEPEPAGPWLAIGSVGCDSGFAAGVGLPDGVGLLAGDGLPAGLGPPAPGWNVGCRVGDPESLLATAGFLFLSLEPDSAMAAIMPPPTSSTSTTPPAISPIMSVLEPDFSWRRRFLVR